MVSKSKRSWRCQHIVVLVLHTKTQWHPKRWGQIMQHKLGTFQCWGVNSRLQPNGFLIWNLSQSILGRRTQEVIRSCLMTASWPPMFQKDQKAFCWDSHYLWFKTWPLQGLYGYVLDHDDITVEPLHYVSTHFLPVCITYFICIKPFSILCIQLAVLPSFLLLS